MADWSATLRGLGDAVAGLRRRVVGATRQGCADELVEVVALARREWPRDTGRSASQLDPRPTAAGAEVRLTGYAPYVRRSGAQAPAWRELILDRIRPARAGERIAVGVRRG